MVGGGGRRNITRVSFMRGDTAKQIPRGYAKQCSSPPLPSFHKQQRAPLEADRKRRWLLGSAPHLFSFAQSTASWSGEKRGWGGQAGRLLIHFPDQEGKQKFRKVPRIGHIHASIRGGQYLPLHPCKSISIHIYKSKSALTHSS